MYKFWIMSENKKIDFRRDSLLDFIKKDIFGRTLYSENQLFTFLCDKICTEV